LFGDRSQGQATITRFDGNNLQQARLAAPPTTLSGNRVEDEVPADIAGWANEDAGGPYTTMELSAKYWKKEP
jgi:hypothetical protein